MKSATVFEEIRGEIRFGESMAKHTSWRVGGPADYWFVPEDKMDLAAFLAVLPEDVPLLWTGLGSNLLVRDGGIRGAVVCTHQGLSSIKTTTTGEVNAEVIPQMLLERVDVVTAGASAAYGSDHGYTAAPIVADVFSFGTNVNNAIYRLELEETDDNTGSFEGSVEYVMLNQLNVDQATTYSAITPISDAIDIIVHLDMTDEDSPRVNYLDLGADGVSTQIADQQAAPTHSGSADLDMDSYKILKELVNIEVAWELLENSNCYMKKQLFKSDQIEANFYLGVIKVATLGQEISTYLILAQIILYYLQNSLRH